MNKKIFYSAMLILVLVLPSGSTMAATTTLKLTNTSLDTVKVEATGEPDSNVKISYLPTGARSMKVVTLGSTDENGSFSTVISSGGYGIPADSPVYATIDDMQSSTMLWPSYSSMITLSKTSTQIAVGQSTSITSSNILILAANSFTSGISTAISGNEIVITGLKQGSGTLVLCGKNVGCGTVSVTVGDESGQTEVSLSHTSVTLDYRESAIVNVFGNSKNGYVVSSNTNPNVVEAYISGSSNELYLYGNGSGTASIKVCSKESATNCAYLSVLALDTGKDSLSFSSNNLSLAPGITQTISVSGDAEGAYYISSNTNASAATAVVNDDKVKVTGGSSTGTSQISVCSATKSSVCSKLYVSNNADTTTASEDVVAFSQNVVKVREGKYSNVTVSGGSGDGYTISSNSNSNAATASISDSGRVLEIYGNNEGNTIIEVCSLDANDVCASVYVIVEGEQDQITFNNSQVSLSGEGSAIITINGGSEKNSVYSVSNNTIVTAKISNNGTTLILTGGTKPGTATVTVCDDDEDSENCADVTVNVAVSSVSGSTDIKPARSTDSQVQQILEEAGFVFGGDVNIIVVNTGSSRNEGAETQVMTKYMEKLRKGHSLNSSQADLMKYFITYGTGTTKILGAGERAGVLGSYKKAFGKLPTTEAEWGDVIKIANGRWPSEESVSALEEAKLHFKTVYLREPDMDNTHDNAAVSVIAYGLRPSNRNIDSEKAAINTFKYIYKYAPSSSLDWDIVRAIAYSGATR